MVASVREQLYCKPRRVSSAAQEQIIHRPSLLIEKGYFDGKMKVEEVD